MKSSTAAALAALVGLSGCASIITGTSQSIAISTPNASAASCVLSNSEGTWSVTTPAVTHVEKSRKDIHVNCSKQGYQDAVAMIPSEFQPWTLGNILIGGLIGVGVDAATGAMNEYPDNFAVSMSPATTSSLLDSASPRVSASFPVDAQYQQDSAQSPQDAQSPQNIPQFKSFDDWQRQRPQK